MNALPPLFSAQLSMTNPKLVRNEDRPPPPCTHFSHAVSKQETCVVLNFPEQRHCLQVIFLCLSTEASNEVAAEAHPCDTQQG